MSGSERRETFVARLEAFKAVQARDGYVVARTLLEHAPGLFTPAPSRTDSPMQRVSNWLRKMEDRGLIDRDSFKKARGMHFTLVPSVPCPHCKGSGLCAAE